MWNRSLFGPQCKQISEWPEPVTQAEAYAAWINNGYSWHSCGPWWDLQPSPDDMEDLDEESRSRWTRQMDEEEYTKINTRLNIILDG